MVLLYACIATRTVRSASFFMHADYLKILIMLSAPRTPRRLSMPPARRQKATSSRQALTSDFSCTTAHAPTRTRTDSYALLEGILDSTGQTRAMRPSRSTPRSACAATHPRSKRSSPPHPSPLHLDSNQAGGRKHGGATPPRQPTADIHHESGNKHSGADAVHFGPPAGCNGEKGLCEL